MICFLFCFGEDVCDFSDFSSGDGLGWFEEEDGLGFIAGADGLSKHIFISALDEPAGIGIGEGGDETLGELVLCKNLFGLGVIFTGNFDGVAEFEEGALEGADVFSGFVTDDGGEFGVVFGDGAPDGF